MPQVTVAAPEVRVEPLAVHVTVEQPRPRAIRAVHEHDGSTVFTVDDEGEE